MGSRDISQAHNHILLLSFKWHGVVEAASCIVCLVYCGYFFHILLDIIIHDESKGKNISAKKASVKMHRKNLVISKKVECR